MECLKFMKDLFTVTFLLMLKQYYQISYQLLRSPIVLLRLIENWKKSLDNKNFVGTVLMDPSKAFDYILHDVPVAKLETYGLSEDVVTFVYSFLKRRKLGVKINDTKCSFQMLLSGIPQSSILGPILFNILINDLFLFIKGVKLSNFQMTLQYMQPGIV